MLLFLNEGILLFLGVLPPFRVLSGAGMGSVEVACLVFHGGGT